MFSVDEILRLRQLPPAIHMMVGYPGSGKSTYARQLADALNAERVSLDDIRAKLYGDASIQGTWSELGPEFRGQIGSALAGGRPVVIDNQNRSLRDRALIKDYDVPAYAYVMDTPWEQAAKNDLIRAFNGGRRVDKDYMLKVRDDPWHAPVTEDEGFAGVTHVPWVSPGEDYDALGDELFAKEFTEPVERMWVGDEDTPENQIFIPPVKRQFKAEETPVSENPVIETYTEGLEDEKPQLPAVPEPEPEPDIDKTIADRQPKSRLSPAQMKRRGTIGDIGYKWGYVLPPMPKDIPDEEIDAYLDWLYDDLQRFIARKKRKQYW